MCKYSKYVISVVLYVPLLGLVGQNKKSVQVTVAMNHAALRIA